MGVGGSQESRVGSRGERFLNQSEINRMRLFSLFD